MSFFSTTATLSHRTLLPSPIIPSNAISLLHNHDFLIRLDPDFISYTENSPPSRTPSTSNATTKYYTITDHMNGIPKALYEAKVTFDAELTELVDGIQWVVKAPLGMTQGSSYKVVEEGEELWLVEDVHVSCSRLLMGTVKAKLESGWSGIHAKIRDRLLEDSGKS